MTIMFLIVFWMTDHQIHYQVTQLPGITLEQCDVLGKKVVSKSRNANPNVSFSYLCGKSKFEKGLDV